jgi:pimeloyl-ACP methyl ester carboxylesterase
MNVQEHTRRSVLAASAAGIGIAALANTAFGEATAGGESGGIRPFRAAIPQPDIDDLRRRIAATRWPDRETVADRSQGNKLATMQDIVRYWGTDYDWRRSGEAKLNAFPQFMTEIDGLDIHFIHVRSKHANALPLIITHGWPGSVFEMLGVIGPLSDPTSYGGRLEDAFDVVVPSMPGYGFSGKPTTTGWGPDRIAQTWAKLMAKLGYTHYVAQGGDWGSPITSAMARQAPAGLAGIHINLPATLPLEIAKTLTPGAPEPTGLSDKERRALDELDAFRSKNSAYSTYMATRPQTIGYALTDSPVGLAAFMFDYNAGEPERALSKDQVLDDITLYWLTNSAASSARLYWENAGRNLILAAAQMTDQIALPVAITVFPGELYQAPETWARRAYKNLVYFHEVDKGGHFAAWEQPALYAQEMRAAFASLRNSA